MENQDTIEEAFEKQCWYVWSEGFRYSYREKADVGVAIKESNTLVDAFKVQFKKG